MKLTFPILAVATLAVTAPALAAPNASPVSESNGAPTASSNPTIDQLQSLSQRAHDFSYDAVRLAQVAASNKLADIAAAAYRVGHHGFRLEVEDWNLNLDADKSPGSPHRAIMDDEYGHAAEEFSALRTLVEAYASSPQAAALNPRPS